ncbi:melanopsin [Daphnia magna]|uniref:melanopsin n=1 Tax=Daphnia magna TaxID=35525 RepID=UPI001E1BC442|nr:melanopsin [Daphnia magna]
MCSLDRKQWANSRNAIGRKGQMMAIPTAINKTNNISGAVLLGHVLNFAMKKQQEKQRHDLLPLVDSNWFDNGTAASSSHIIKAASDATTVELLMPVWAYQTAAVYLICICVVGLIMNVIVVIVILNDPQKSPLNWMLLNLACSDGIIAGFGAPISASAAFQFDWPFGNELCIAYAMIMSTAGIGSITTLTALALWRCQLVVYCPAKRGSAFANNNNSNGGRLGHCRAVLLLAIIWTYSLAVTCPPLFGWGRYDREASHISCSVNWESKMDNNRLYILYMFAFGLFVPLAVIVVSYVSILRVVRKAGKFKKTMSTMSHNVDQSQEISNQQQVQTLHKTERKKQTSDAAEKRVTVMVACMVGAFLTAWTPYSILALFETFTGEMGLPSNGNFSWRGNGDELHYVGTISPGFATIPSLFAKTSAVLNPLIYGLLNTQFRTAWEKFSVRFLSRRQRRKNKEMRHLLSCIGHKTPTLKPSTSVHFSMKEMVSNESQSAYVMARHVVASPPVVRFVQQQHEPPIRLKCLSPSLASSSSTADADTSVANQQSIQTRGFKNSLLPRQDEEEVGNEPGKLVVILSITESTSCTTTTDDHAFTATLEEESVFSEQTPVNVSDSLDINLSPTEN